MREGTDSLLDALRTELENGSAYWNRLLERDVLAALVDVADAAREASRRPFGQLYERDHYRMRETLAALDRLRGDRG